MMKHKYTIRYIDGHDLRYKSFNTIARSESEAIKNLWDKYAELGDFDHHIAGVLCSPLSIIALLKG